MAENNQSAYEKILGRQITAEEIQRLEHIKETLNIHENDALFTILIAFESYYTQMKRIPEIHLKQIIQLNESQQELYSRIMASEAQKNMMRLQETMHSMCIANMDRRSKRNLYFSVTIATLFIAAYGIACFMAGYMSYVGDLHFTG